MSALNIFMTRSRLFITFIFVFGRALSTEGKGFMKRTDTREEVEASLLAELAGTFRPSATKDHIISLEASLRPMYTAVPQEADGTLRHTVVRYVLHRFFAQRGWFIRGLEPGSTAGNSSSGEDSLQALQEWVPSFLQNFLEQLAGGRGISLRELAVLAATIEDLVHKETINRLEQAFGSLELSLTAELNDKQVSEVLEVFMMIYMVGGNFKVKGPENVRKAHEVFTQKVKDWNEVQDWMKTVKQKLYPSMTYQLNGESVPHSTLDFNAVGRIVEEIGATYATYNKKECASLKAELLQVESQKAGRVRLPDFYKKGLSGVFEFNEKVDYLRVLGALDEYEPKQPHVIVPNYVASRPNCLVASSFYVICCSNECEPLMAKLENAIGSEMAIPEQIITLVSALSSDSVTAPRKLSPTLVGRLQSIAKSNNGQVPLHGRLFAQWMHHAFPRECPFPHQEGSTNPQTPDEWMQAAGHESSKASTEEMKAHVDGDTEVKPTGEEARKHHHLEENELPWSEAEELLLPFGGSKNSGPRSVFRTFAVFALLLSMASGIIWATKMMLSGTEEQKCLPNLGLNSVDFVKEACKMA